MTALALRYALLCEDFTMSYTRALPILADIVVLAKAILGGKGVPKALQLA